MPSRFSIKNLFDGNERKIIFRDDDFLLWIHFVVVRNWNFRRNNHGVLIEYSIREIHEKLLEFHRINTKDVRIIVVVMSEKFNTEMNRSELISILLVIEVNLVHLQFVLRFRSLVELWAFSPIRCKHTTDFQINVFLWLL